MPNLNEELLERAKDFFRTYIIGAHIEGSLKRAAKVENYNVHPFLYKYLANFLEGNDDPKSIAKALLFPRILGTSITTMFGMKTQKMVSVLFQGMGSAIPGIDIEFTDQIDGRKKYAQLKSGPNTINKDDIKTVLDHFQGIRNIARTNNLDVRLSDLVVGVIYGTHDELSSHYLQIEKTHNVYIGSEFWYHLTGQEDFYLQLIEAIGEVALEVDAKGRVEATIEALAKDVEDNLLQ